MVDVNVRFFSASDDKPEDGGVVSASKRWNEAVRALATAALQLPPGPNYDIAMERLEDVQMRGNRALFIDVPPVPPMGTVPEPTAPDPVAADPAAPAATA